MNNLVQYHIARPGMPLPPIQAALYEYILAGNGIFIRGTRREFQAQFCIVPCEIRGLADFESLLRLNAPRVSREIVTEMLRRARAARDADGRPCEIVFHLELDEARVWHCLVPSQAQGPARAKPADDSPSSSYARACIEVHSHVDMHARFSSLDNQDEVGFRVYAILGCISTRAVMRVRVGMYGYRCDIPADWVFDLPPEVGDAVTGEGTLLGPIAM
ncbi:MAG: hypothetical protein AB1817_21530, partial [Chloroflexota bacterium]